jgi:hypothetical protein
MGLFQDLWGTVKSTFQISIGGVRLKNNSANLEIRSAGDTDYADITAKNVKVTGDSIDLNSDAASAGSDWKYTIVRPASGMSAAVTLTLPTTDGSPNQLIYTDGSGNLGWVDASGSQDALVHVDTTTVAYGDSSPKTMFNLPANAVLHQVSVLLDTAWDGSTPNMSIGIAGSTSKYMATSENNLKGTAKDVYTTNPCEAASGSPEALIATFNASGSSAGTCRVLVYYSTPA